MSEATSPASSVSQSLKSPPQQYTRTTHPTTTDVEIGLTTTDVDSSIINSYSPARSSVSPVTSPVKLMTAGSSMIYEVYSSSASPAEHAASSSYSQARTSLRSSTTQPLVSLLSPSSTVTSPVRAMTAGASMDEVGSSSSVSHASMATTASIAVRPPPMTHAAHNRLSADTTTKELSSATHDTGLKNNLLSMISKSEERRRKPRALPNIRGIKSPTSPSNPELSLHATLDDGLKPEITRFPTSPKEGKATEHSPPMHGLKNESSPMHLMEPLSLIPREMTPGASKQGRSLPLSPMEHLTTEYSLPTSPLESNSKSHDFVRSSLLQSPESFLPKSPETLELSPLVTELAGIGEEGIVNPETQPSVNGLKSPADPKQAGHHMSETMIQPTPEDSSSSTELDVRNLVPLELEIESKENYAPPASSDGSLASDRSLPTGLGLQHANLEEVVATSLPDLDNQYQAENLNQR